MGEPTIIGPTAERPRAMERDSWQRWLVYVVGPGLCGLLLLVTINTMGEVKSELQQFRTLMTTIQIATARSDQRLFTLEADLSRMSDKLERHIDRSPDN